MLTRNVICDGNLPVLLGEREAFLRALIEFAITIEAISRCAHFRRVLSYFPLSFATIQPYKVALLKHHFQEPGKRKQYTLISGPNQNKRLSSPIIMYFSIMRIDVLSILRTCPLSSRHFSISTESELNDINTILHRCRLDDFMVTPSTESQTDLKCRLDKAVGFLHAVSQDEYKNIPKN